MRHKPIFVILMLCLLLPTAMSAQNVTGNFSSTTLGAVLDEVEARTGYHFIFDSNEINTNINSQKYIFQANINAFLTSTTKVSLKMNTQLHFQHTPE